MAETYYLFGSMLLLMDSLIIGSVREKIVISYIRSKVNIIYLLLLLIHNMITRVVKML